MMNRSVCGALVALAILGAGCSSSSKPKSADEARRLSQREADQLAKDNANFENAQDPPISAETHFAAGQLAEAQEQPGKALDQYKAALKVDPNYQPALFRMGEVYTQLKMFPDAVETWQRYIKLTNGAAEGYNNLAFTYEMARDPKNAEAAYKRGIARDPKDQACRTNYGLMLARQGRIAEATEQFSAVLKPAEVHYNLGSVFEQQGKSELARAEYQRALMIDPSLKDAKARLAGLK
jgi:Tfp pilus assembly protein PilF